MSSYFDTMGRCLSDPNAVVDLAVKQYQSYLRTVVEEAEPKYKDAAEELLNRFGNMIYSKSWATERPEWKLQRLHDLAHDVGRAGIRRKDGGGFGDNPDIAY